MSRVVAIVGATATGKSGLALWLAERIGGEIVSADALQAYRGFDIGTAKPTADERRRVRHHLLDILEPHERYSAGEFARRARLALGEIRRRGRVPLVVGGSGLYLRALLDGIRSLPPADAAVRRELRERLERDGPAPLRAQLERLDPEAAGRIEAGDTQRLLRALEVALSTGRPLSQWIAERPFGVDALDAVRIGLTLPRTILYDRIALRVRRMLDGGWVDEVRRLLARESGASAPAFQAIGYRQLSRHVLGQWPLEKAIVETIQATRRFAKRQETWFRREGGIEWFSAVAPQRCRERVARFLSLHGVGGANGKTEH